MKRTVWLQETKRMRFDAPHAWYRRDGGAAQLQLGEEHVTGCQGGEEGGQTRGASETA